jgi:hypothetical protein
MSSIRALVVLFASGLLALAIGCFDSTPGTPVSLPTPAIAPCAPGLVRIRDGLHHFKCITQEEDTEHAVVISPRICEQDSDCERGEACNTDLHAPGHPTEGTCYLLR